MASDMERKLLYAFRGWIAFVAFMDLGTTVRCFIENRSFIGELPTSISKHDHNDPLLSRILGIYSVLKAITLIHCTLFIHYKPVVSMGMCVLLITLLMCGSEVLYFHSTALTFYIIFPCVLNGLTLLGLLMLPRRLLDSPPVTEDENVELLKQATAFKRRRPKKNN
ncbi:uncharacterized protein LOC124555329 [Schistocerca americana]|uniref:uncharacterized protein LOC124555329 n=1 Tax=Schistocerca americana TaxID=7009 RepID=UPI001F4F3EF0|nr:uncharacterized protein LOC124555329 [Schistocerca americana]XP_047102031.1 uncharacterized protein LOC124721222 [Schistocerca piceifrons]XP_049955622.1 uncharacterized protein LOC126471468 [Schistocerca serialis cubense]